MERFANMDVQNAKMKICIKYEWKRYVLEIRVLLLRRSLKSFQKVRS